MHLETEILLCDCAAGFDDTRRFAVLDERTLTYDVVERRADGPARVLHRQVPSLRQARMHACAGRSYAGACPRATKPPRADRTVRLMGTAARPGSVVRVVDQAGRTVDYELTGSAPPEDQPLPVSVNSPVGRALVGAAPGDWVSLTVANGRRKRVQVVDVLPKP